MLQNVVSKTVDIFLGLDALNNIMEYDNCIEFVVLLWRKFMKFRCVLKENSSITVIEESTWDYS